MPQQTGRLMDDSTLKPRELGELDRNSGELWSCGSGDRRIGDREYITNVHKNLPV